MRIDPKNLNLTPEVVEELERNYDTRVVFEDYFIDFTAYEGEINKQFFHIFKKRLQEATDPGEKWVKRYVGKDQDGWEHLEQKLYRGPNPPEYAQPHELHWKIDVYFRPRTTPRRNPIKPRARGTGWGNKILGGFVAVLALDSLFPAKAGESVFVRDTVGAYAFMKYLDAKHEKNQE